MFYKQTYFLRKVASVFLICSILGALPSAGMLELSTGGHPLVNLQSMLIQGTSTFDYVLIIMMEDHAFSSITGSSSAAYLNQLASSNSLLTGYTAISHPSLPNYLALTGGSSFGVTSNCPPTTSCNSGAKCCPISAPNIIDAEESAGLTWKAYMEDYPTACGSHCSLGKCFMGTNSTGYVVTHNPFAYYADIVSNPDRCARIVSANSVISQAPQSDDKLLDDLQSTSTASNYMWLSPGLCDDMHDCLTVSGDVYLRTLVPKILSSNVFKTQRAALFVTFDEGSPSRIFPNDFVFTLWAGPVVKTNYKSSQQYSHYSLLTTIEATWGIQNLTSNDGDAKPMVEFFRVPAPNTILGLQPPLFYGMIASIVVGAVGVGVIGSSRRKPSAVAKPPDLKPRFPSPWRHPGVLAIVIVESGVIAFLSFWIVEEYLNNAYFRNYVSQITISSGLGEVMALGVGILLACLVFLVRVRFMRKS